MKNNLKKCLLILLCLCMLASCLVGCADSAPSSTPDSSSKSDTDKTPSTDADTPADEEPVSNFNETGYPIVNEPITLKVMVQKNELTDDFAENEIFKALEEKTNVKIEWEYVGVDWDTQKQLLLASPEEMPDVFIGQTIGETDVLSNSDMFVPLEDYIEKYMPNLKAGLVADPDMERFITAPDGHIYGLPEQMPGGGITMEMGMINKTWLDNLGLDVPTTTEELYTVLKAFKEQDANGNGDPNDEIPFTFIAYDNLVGCRGLWGSFDLPTASTWNAVNIALIDDKVYYAPAMEGFKEWVSYMHRLYSEGLIDVEAFTQDWTMYPAKLNNEGDSIVGMAYHWTIGSGMGDHTDEYVTLAPLTGPSGNRPTWRLNTAASYAGYRFIVTKNCEYPEVAMRWADEFYENEMALQVAYGPIGTTIEKTDDGKYVLLDPPEGVTAAEWQWKYSMNSSGLGFVDKEFDKNLVLSGDTMAKFEGDQLYREYFPTQTYPLISFSQEQLDELAILQTDIDGYWEQQAATWIVNGGVEEEWDSYLAMLEQMGVEQYVQIYQDAYDTYISR